MIHRTIKKELLNKQELLEVTRLRNNLAILNLPAWCPCGVKLDKGIILKYFMHKFKFGFISPLVLTKTWNYLKLPKTNWNNLQRVKTTYNDLNLPITSKNENAKRKTTSRFWDYFTKWSNRFNTFSIQHMIATIRAPNVYILSCVFITGYRTCRIRCKPLWFKTKVNHA